MKRRVLVERYEDWDQPWWIEELEEDLDNDAVSPEEYGFMYGYNE